MKASIVEWHEGGRMSFFNKPVLEKKRECSMSIVGYKTVTATAMFSLDPEKKKTEVIFMLIGGAILHN